MNWRGARRQFETALIWVSAASLAFVLWQVRLAVLLAFGTIVLAILLNVLASLIADWTGISDKFGLAIATTFIVLLFAVMFWRFGSQLSTQFSGLMEHIQSGERSLRAMLQNNGFTNLASSITEKGTSLIAGSLKEMVSVGLGFIEAVIVVAISAIYLAAQPQLYRHGIAMLFRPPLRPRVIRSVDLIGRALKLWLLGQLVLMIGVGILSFVAVWLIGLPNPGALALLAGVAEIVPYIGPFLSAIPAVLVALTLGMSPVVWTIVAYLLIHLFEGYITAPLVERYFVTIPPALILLGIVIANLLFGIVGVILAAPITVVVYMAVKMAYVEDPLE
jgi:predicted PurR-regulated permease PerM